MGWTHHAVLAFTNAQKCSEYSGVLLRTVFWTGWTLLNLIKFQIKFHILFNLFSILQISSLFFISHFTWFHWFVISIFLPDLFLGRIDSDVRFRFENTRINSRTTKSSRTCLSDFFFLEHFQISKIRYLSRWKTELLTKVTK